jgi:molybdopterin molybdotransferase
MSDELDTPEALRQLAQGIVPVSDRECIPLAAAAGRVLASDVTSTLDVPAFDNAAMDGYAIRSADCGAGAELREVGRALAGHPYPAALRSGETVRIMTGAALPAGADAVVMLEDVAAVDGRVGGH